MRQNSWTTSGTLGLGRYAHGANNRASSGERLANYRSNSTTDRAPHHGWRIGSMHTSVGSNSGTPPRAIMKTEGHNASMLGRNRATVYQATFSCQQSPNGYQSADERSSGTIDRRWRTDIKERLFGSKSSLNKVQPQADGKLVNSTIISNPHATFSNSRHYTDNTPPTSPIYVNQRSSYSFNGRPSSATSPTSRSPRYSSNSSVFRDRLSMSDTESMDSISSSRSSSTSSSVQARIEQARAHGYVSRTILAQEKEGLTHQPIQRSDSFRSTQSEHIYPSRPQQEHARLRTGSFSSTAEW